MKTLLVLIALCATQIASAVDLPDGVSVGDKAPNFAVRNIDGNTITLNTFQKTDGVILIFTCNHCPFSVAYEDRIIALHEEFSKQGWPVLAINPNDPERVPEDSFENMKVRAKEKGFTFPYAMDATQNVAKAYGARRTPHVFLLKKTKVGFTVAYIGAIDDSPRSEEEVETQFVKDAINTMILGSNPETTITKAIGCTIKWKE